MVHEFEGGRTRAAFLAVDHDEIRDDAGFDNGLDDGHELPMVADAELEAHGLAAGELAQFCDEGHEFKRRCKGGVRWRRDAILAQFDAPDGGYFRRDLYARAERRRGRVWRLATA